MGKRKLVVFDVDDTLILLEGKNKDKVKNPHRLLPLMLFVANSPDHELAMLTNRGYHEEGFERDAEKTFSTLDLQSDLNQLGVKIDDPYVIRQPREYREWETSATTDFAVDLYLKEDHEYPGLKAQKQNLQAKILKTENKIKTIEAANPRPHTAAVANEILGHKDIVQDYKRDLEAVENPIYAKFAAKKGSLDADAKKKIEAELGKKIWR